MLKTLLLFAVGCILGHLVGCFIVGDIKIPRRQPKQRQPPEGDMPAMEDAESPFDKGYNHARRHMK